MKVFGCVCYAHIPDEKRSKLDEKGERCIFMGYVYSTKGYRLYNLEKKKLIINRDVVFDEKASWNWEEKKMQENHLTPTSVSQGQPIVPATEDQGKTPSSSSS